MKVLTRLAWGSAKFWLGAIVVIGAALAVGRDAAPAHAANPEILMSLSNGSPTWTSTTLVLKSDGRTYGSTPCDPGENNKATLCLYIWAKDAYNTGPSAGVSAFAAHFSYPDNLIAISYAVTSNVWLGSTGRSAVCPDPLLTPGDVYLQCDTFLQAPPVGATGSGLLGTVALSSKSAVGLATLNLSFDGRPVGLGPSKLVDTPSPSDPPTEPAEITTTKRSTNVFVAPCADFTGEGLVKANDILYVVRKYHSTDAAADLDRSGLVTSSDILISVREYNWTCTA